MSKIRKPHIEFYITNVCNFNCDNCNRLNNYHFAGHEIWADYENIYQRWSQLIDIEEMNILGGEPLLNPSLDQWILGLRDCWPEARINLLSNGSRLDYWYQRGFYQLLSKTQTKLNITLHNRGRRNHVINQIRSHLSDPSVEVVANPDVDWVRAYDSVKDPEWPTCTSYEDFLKLPSWIQDECINVHQIGWENWTINTGLTMIKDLADLGIRIEINYSENFTTAPLKYAGNNRFQVYDSDPEQAHHVCRSKHCTHMMKGKIYKCHHVALLPEFGKQYLVEMTEEDRQLLQSYRPLTVNDSTDIMQQFMDDLPNSIPQCKLCPSKLEPVFLQSSTDKPKVKKIYQLEIKK